MQLVSLTARAVELYVAQDVTTYERSRPYAISPLQVLLMGVMVPVFHSDYDGNAGTVHGSV